MFGRADRVAAGRSSDLILPLVCHCLLRCGEFAGPASIVLAPGGGHVLYVVYFLCPGLNLLEADNALVVAYLDVFQHKGAAVQDIVYLVEPLLVLCGKVLVIRGVDVPNDTLGNHAQLLSV